jgi:anti-sigma factor RsiW
MDHPEIKQKLFDYPDGLIGSEDKEVLKEHLQTCPDCQNLVENWHQISKNFLQPLHAVPTEVFVQNVMRKVRAYVLRDDVLQWRHFVRWAFPVLALSVSGFVAILTYTLEPTQTSPTALLIGEATPSYSTEILANSSSDDHLMDSVIMEQ